MPTGRVSLNSSIEFDGNGPLALAVVGASFRLLCGASVPRWRRITMYTALARLQGPHSMNTCPFEFSLEGLLGCFRGTKHGPLFPIPKST